MPTETYGVFLLPQKNAALPFLYILFLLTLTKYTQKSVKKTDIRMECMSFMNPFLKSHTDLKKKCKNKWTTARRYKRQETKVSRMLARYNG